MGNRLLRRFLSVSAASTLVAVGVAGIAGASLTIGLPPEFEAELAFAPKEASRTRLTPASLSLEVGVRPLEGTHTPGVRELQIEMDRAVAVDVEGLPTCHFDVEGPSDPGAACRDALVGTGRMNVSIALPEAEEVDFRTKLLVFNGGSRDGVTTLFIRGYITVPVPASIVTTMHLHRIQKGPYGLLTMVSIPKIAGGSGSVTSFRIRIDKKFTYKGERVGVVGAKCPDHKLESRLRGILIDGSIYGVSIVQPCTGTD